MTPGELLRETRKSNGISQSRLATRAGTTQSAISRIERDRVSPTFETLQNLLYLLGEDLSLSSSPRDVGLDRSLYRSTLEASPDDRVKKGLAFSRFVADNRGAALR